MAGLGPLGVGGRGPAAIGLVGAIGADRQHRKPLRRHRPRNGPLRRLDHPLDRRGKRAVRELARSSGSVTPWTYAKGDLMPFWGKPPLQFWLTAISYRAFGVSECSARLPSFLVALAARRRHDCFAAGLWGRNVAVLAGIVLATSLALLVLSGACELDVPLTAGASGAMMAFALFAAIGTVPALAA